MTSNRVGDLSERQVQCLHLVARLQTTKQIAATLGIAPSTVDTHIQRAIEILGVRNRAEAAAEVVGLPSPGPGGLSSGDSRLAGPPAAEATTGPGPADVGPRNRLGTLQRLGAGIAALVLLSFAVAGLGAAIGKLSDWRYAIAKARNERGPLRAETGTYDEDRSVSRRGGGDPPGIPAGGADGQRGGGAQRQAAGDRP